MGEEKGQRLENGKAEGKGAKKPGRTQGNEEKRGIDVSVRVWWGCWAPINRRAAAPHLSTLVVINTATQIGI